VFHDDPTPLDNGDDNGNIFMVRSTDGGKTWSAAQTVDGDGKDQFMPSIAIAKPGRMMIGYYSRAQSAANALTHFGGRMGVIKPNGAVKLYPRFQLGPNTGIPSAVDPDIDVTDFQAGYFNQFAASAGNYLAAWSDSRFAPEGGARQPDIHFARIAAKQPKMDLQVATSFLPASVQEEQESLLRIRLKAVGGKANDAYASLPAIPPGTEIRNVYGGDCHWTSSRASCSLGTIPAGGKKDMFVSLRPFADGSFQLTGHGSTTSLDTKGSNNKATATLTATPKPAEQEQSYSSGNLTTTITDMGQTIVPLPIPDSGKVKSVTVALRLDRSFMADLRIQLVNPSLTASTLLMEQEGGGDNNVGTGANDCSGAKTTLVDTAATAIVNANAPFNGSFRPEEALAEQANGQLKGTWLLVIQDGGPGDTGTIGCFEMTVKYE
jgi:subtilisin-like proprotein convertase family protein